MRTQVSRLSSQLSTLKRQRDERCYEASSCTLSLNANTHMRSLYQNQQRMLLGASSALSDWMVSPSHGASLVLISRPVGCP